MQGRMFAAAVTTALVAELAVGCSSSTSPSDPFPGAWSITVHQLVWRGEIPPDTGSVTPEPLVLVISKSGQSYTANWPMITWSVTVGGNPVQIFTVGSTGPASPVAGDTLEVNIPFPLAGTGCQFQIRGAFQGSSAQGAVYVAGGQCGTATAAHLGEGTWSATKQ